MGCRALFFQRAYPMTFVEKDFLAGSSFPVGPTLTAEGVNFSIYTRFATGIELLLFDDVNDKHPSRIVPFDPIVNRTNQYWHMFVPGLKKGQLYGFKVHGPFAPEKGHRYDTSKMLLDPYAKAVAIPEKFKRHQFTVAGQCDGTPMKSVITDLTQYDWESDRHPGHDFADTIIYELHVAGFTKHPNSGVSAGKQGTFLGLIEKIPYLVDLGITAVELMPVFQFDAQDALTGTNYWGYSPISFFAPHQGYAYGADPCAVLDEFRDMVKALHQANIEVILDVVYNHTTENGEHGPTYSFRGIDNKCYYLLQDDKARYANFSGTGNTLNASMAPVRRMIVDSLHFWVKHMHVDGFRFDLASILSRDHLGKPFENPSIIWDIDTDPVLAGTKLIAEAWDAGGLYQVGRFMGDRWKEWNGRFRDDVRSFLRGDDNAVQNVGHRMIGSPDVFGHREREPEQGVNFVTCHDGFTLNDLVSYNAKHNEQNGENNRDGSDHNVSFNGGVEGPSDNPALEQFREQQIKNFFCFPLLSIGVPMILMGDEVRRTQEGNNNAYCVDSELTWFDWSLVGKNAGLLRFVKQLIKLRKLEYHEATRLPFLSLNDILKEGVIQWHGVKLNNPDWSHASHSLSINWISRNEKSLGHAIANAYHQPLEFELPKVPVGQNRQWRLLIDTAKPSPDDINLPEEAPDYAGNTYWVKPHSVVVLWVSLT